MGLSTVGKTSGVITPQTTYQQILSHHGPQPVVLVCELRLRAVARGLGCFSKTDFHIT